MKLSRSMLSRLIGLGLILLVFSIIGAAFGLEFQVPLWKAAIVWPIGLLLGLALFSACVMALVVGFYMLCTGEN